MDYLCHQVFPRGWDKTFCLQYVENEFSEIHFFGDKTYPVPASSSKLIAFLGSPLAVLDAVSSVTYYCLHRFAGRQRPWNFWIWEDNRPYSDKPWGHHQAVCWDFWGSSQALTLEMSKIHVKRCFILKGEVVDREFLHFFMQLCWLVCILVSMKWKHLGSWKWDSGSVYTLGRMKGRTKLFECQLIGWFNSFKSGRRVLY